MRASRLAEGRGRDFRARASYVRGSAYKARQVLDLIRGRSCGEAYDILAFSERAVARRIGKVLHSAVSNAHYDNALDADELYVSACYADEGPTLKRWRPRARGRSTRIRKRTCHITVVVRRYSEEMLDRMRARDGRAGNSVESRRRRVARSLTRRRKGDSSAAVKSEAAAVDDAAVKSEAAAVDDAAVKSEAAAVDDAAVKSEAAAVDEPLGGSADSAGSVDTASDSSSKESGASL